MVLKSLLGDEKVTSKVNNPSIVIAEKIDPSQIAEINQTNLLGIIQRKVELQIIHQLLPKH